MLTLVILAPNGHDLIHNLQASRIPLFSSNLGPTREPDMPSTKHTGHPFSCPANSLPAFCCELSGSSACLPGSARPQVTVANSCSGQLFRVETHALLGPSPGTVPWEGRFGRWGVGLPQSGDGEAPEPRAVRVVVREGPSWVPSSLSCSSRLRRLPGPRGACFCEWGCLPSARRDLGVIQDLGVVQLSVKQLQHDRVPGGHTRRESEAVPRGPTLSEAGEKGVNLLC